MTVDDDEKVIAGTGRYMAPELSSDRGYDWRADLYSLGISYVEISPELSVKLETIKERGVKPEFIYDALIKECFPHNDYLMLLDGDPVVREMALRIPGLWSGFREDTSSIWCPQLSYAEATTSEVIDRFASFQRLEFAFDRERAGYIGKSSIEEIVSNMNTSMSLKRHSFFDQEWHRVLPVHPFIEAEFLRKSSPKNPKDLSRWLKLCFSDSPTLLKFLSLETTGSLYLFHLTEDFEDLFFAYFRYLCDDLHLSFETGHLANEIRYLSFIRGSSLHPQLRRMFPEKLWKPYEANSFRQLMRS